MKPKRMGISIIIIEYILNPITSSWDLVTGEGEKKSLKTSIHLE